MNEWPDKKPNVPADEHGWFQKANEQVLKAYLNDKTKLVIELGSWLGKSTRFIAKQAPNATVVAIDHWEGNPGHKGREDVKDKLLNLYETFLVNMWDFKERVKVCRMSTKQGLKECYEMKMKPDVIYIDAAHDYNGAMHDIVDSMKYFPDAVIIGDDWNWHNKLREYTVRKAVIDYAYKNNKHLQVFSNVWWFV